MKQYLFEGEIEGNYRELEIDSPLDGKNYMVHWYGITLGSIYAEEIDGEKRVWKTDAQPLQYCVSVLGDFIDRSEQSQ